jgi:hypothetical protein
MARAAWLKVTCRTRDSKRRILLYLIDFCTHLSRQSQSENHFIHLKRAITSGTGIQQQQNLKIIHGVTCANTLSLLHLYAVDSVLAYGTPQIKLRDASACASVLLGSAAFKFNHCESLFCLYARYSSIRCLRHF